MRLLDYFKKPLFAGVAAGILGLIFGLVIGWVVWPVNVVNTAPAALSPVHKEDYLRMAVDSFARNNDVELARIRIENVGAAEAAQILDTIANNPDKQDPAAAMKMRDGARALAAGQGQVVPTQAPNGSDGGVTTTPTIFSNRIMLITLGGILALIVIVGAAYVFWSRVIRGRQPASPEEYSPARQAQEITNATEKTDFTDMGLQEPMVRTMMTYVFGDEYFDESSSVNAANGDFQGEYGVAVSKLIGVGEPKRATALELWLFDKNDVATATKVLMTPHAFGNQEIRNELQAKGGLELAKPHGQVLLETKTLQLLATVKDLQFGQGNLPDSYYERITLEFAVWPKPKPPEDGNVRKD